MIILSAALTILIGFFLPRLIYKTDWIDLLNLCWEPSTNETELKIIEKAQMQTIICLILCVVIFIICFCITRLIKKTLNKRK